MPVGTRVRWNMKAINQNQFQVALNSRLSDDLCCSNPNGMDLINEVDPDAILIQHLRRYPPVTKGNVRCSCERRSGAIDAVGDCICGPGWNMAEP